MEIIEKQVEKVKEVPADNYGYNYGRRDINGKANAGLTLGIIGTALGAWALFGGRRSASLLGGTGTGSGADANIAIATCGGSANGVNAPTAFQAWEKECEDTLALQAGIYTDRKTCKAIYGEACLPNTPVVTGTTPTDVYVAINSQYHDYVELFKSWFGDNVDQKIIESAIIFWFKDVDCKSRNKVVSYFKEY